MDPELGFVMANDSPIVCLMCKSARKKDERLLMFGGSRPFMSKFEAKFVSFIGRDKFLDLQEKYKTKRNRSYICKYCYSVVNKTFDNIQRIQQGVVRSVRRCLSQDDEHYDYDLKLSSSSQENLTKKKLPPVAERIAKKVASLTLVKINHRVPRIVLQPVINRADTDGSNKNDNCEMSIFGFNESHDARINHLGEMSGPNKNSLQNVLPNINNGECNAHKPQNDVKRETLLIGQSNNMCTSDELCTLDELCIHNSAALNISARAEPSRSIDEECDKKSHRVNERQVNVRSISQSPEQFRSIDEECDKKSPSVNERQANVRSTSLLDFAENSFNDNQHSSTKSSSAELAEILANPLLMVKSPQPIKLLDVKDGNVYMCGEDGCDWIFSSRFFWENHIRHYHYYGKPHKCPFDDCNKYFPTKSKQKQHVRQHTGERPFVCEECGKAFRGSQELRHHRGTHTVGKPYQCPKSGCYKSFKYINSMKRHLQFHDGNYPFPCSYPKCTKAFKNKYELKCHNRLHTGERPYKCKEPGCSKAFRLPCEYTKHRRAHTGERPFKCAWEGCSAAYITCGGLASHMLSHSNDQHFCCEFCGKTFKHKLSYHSHLRKHIDPSEKLSCDVEGCGKLNMSKEQLLNHMTDAHGQLQIHNKRLKSSSQKYLCYIENCGKECVNRKLMSQHMASKHSIQNYQPSTSKNKKICLPGETRHRGLGISPDVKCSKLKSQAQDALENSSTQEIIDQNICLPI